MKAGMIGSGLGAAVVALALVASWNGSAAAADVVIPPGTPSLSTGVLLSGSDSLTIVGAGTPWSLDAGGFSIATTAGWVGTIRVADCDIVNLGTATTLAIDVRAGAGATFDVQRTTFAASAAFVIQATGDLTFKFSDNVLVGPGAGLRIDAQTATGIVVRGNYIHSTVPADGSLGSELLDAQGDGTMLVEHNVLRGGNGVVGIFSGGELRYNLLGDPSGGAWVVIGSDAGARIHHNIFVRNNKPAQKVTGVSVVAPATNPTSSVYNNTIDGSGTCYGATSRAVAVDENAFLPSLRDNAIFNFPSDDGAANTALVGPGLNVGGELGMKGDPGPARLGYADFNLFYNLMAATQDNYGISVANLTERHSAGFALGDPIAQDAKDQQVDPRLVAPPPVVFPFADDVIVSGQVNVCQILAFYRSLYTPGPESLLIDKGDPMDGVGTDIGAVGAGTPAAADLFGTVCADADRVLAARPAVVTTCPQPDVDGGTTPLDQQGRSIVCVCEAAPAGRLGSILAPTIALVFLALGLRPARARRRTGGRSA